MKDQATVLNWIDTQKQTVLQNLREWVQTNSYSVHLQGLETLAKLLYSSFAKLHGISQLIELPPCNIMDSNGLLIEQKLGKAISIRKRSDAPKQILLGGHFDTVYPPNHHFQNIVEEQDRWNGPGVADMKGGIAVLLVALEAFERSPLANQIGWEILLTPDEEIGSPGSASLYEAAAKRNDLGLLFEPSFPDGSFVSKRKGSATIQVLVKGRAAHVGRDFFQGKSAVFALTRFISGLEKLIHPNLTINVTDLKGDGPVNIVPPLASCIINLRSFDPAILQQGLMEMQRLANEGEEDGIHITILQESIRAPKPFDVKVHKLFDEYASCAKELDIPFQTRETGGVCDGNILAGAGLPTLDTAGVVGGYLHTPEEYVFIPSLFERAKLTTLFLLRFAAGEINFKKEVRND